MQTAELQIIQHSVVRSLHYYYYQAVTQYTGH